MRLASEYVDAMTGPVVTAQKGQPVLNEPGEKPHGWLTHREEPSETVYVVMKHLPGAHDNSHVVSVHRSKAGAYNVYSKARRKYKDNRYSIETVSVED